MPDAKPDANFMRRAIALAMRGRGSVEPNPVVGCVIVKEDGRIIGEGWHQQYGGPHAEPNALASCTESPEGATAYITLEPCCHTNKQTPPCVPRLIAAKLARVVVGAVDPNPQVAGRGVAQLRAAGLVVDTGVLEPECKQLAAAFFARIVHHRPYVTLKWAQTADGKIAGPHGQRLQISNEASSREVHRLRARCDTIIVGLRTVLKDDPMLTARGVDAARPLLRAVLDADLRIPISSNLVRTAHDVPVRVFCSTATYAREKAIVAALGAYGVQVQSVPTTEGQRLSIPDILHLLGGTHVLVEPGPTLAIAFLPTEYADRLWVIESPKRLGDALAPQAPPIPHTYQKTGEVNLNGDRLTEYLNPASPLFFKAEPSADFLGVPAGLGQATTL